ncbi:D-alanyl-D-alanine carboxypeptidase family protein [Sporosarcina sp. NPDC096371]|uniref:M15 family metallopeptidase n=1 Tax=Sporosarcina sp. NPDC096371 TaxID=3364530 RepID=UPI00381F9643
MKKKNKYNYQQKKKGQGKALTITLVISGILMTGLVAWIGVNDWSVEQSTKKFQEVIGLSAEDGEEAENPKEGSDSVEPPKVTVGGGDDSIEGEPDESAKEPEKPATTPDTPSDSGGYIEGQELPLEPTYVEGILIANKKYPLPATFAPGEDKEAREAFDQMAAEARLSGFNLTAFSTYRAFDYQVTLYERYVTRDGIEAADTYSARPGYSEHQTGLAFDIGEENFEKHWASSTFGDTEAGKWVAANAHRFGFIMRYPVGKEQVTGYMHEAWHFRYVGTTIAADIYKNKSTLEEYLEIQ